MAPVLEVSMKYKNYKEEMKVSDLFNKPEFEGTLVKILSIYFDEINRELYGCYMNRTPDKKKLLKLAHDIINFCEGLDE